MREKGEAPSPASHNSRVRVGYNAAEALAGAEAELGRLEGLVVVKNQVRALLHVSIDRLQYDGANIKIGSENYNYNCIVMGNSGVGKSTLVENVLYPALNKIGVLTGKLVKVSKEDLKGKGYDDKYKAARFGMLFIDEAYVLTDIMIEKLVHLSKKGGSVMVVLVGYQDELSRRLCSNQGLRARFEHTIVIPDYLAEELVTIGTRYCDKKNFGLSGDGAKALQTAAERVASFPPGASPANADAIEKIIRSAVDNFRIRRQQSGRAKAMALELTAADIDAGLAKLQSDWDAVGSSSAASGGGSSSGAHSTAALLDMSEEAKTVVVTELKAKFEPMDECMEKFGDVIGKLSDESLLKLALGNDAMVQTVRKGKSNRSHYRTLEKNLILCVRDAFPACEVIDHGKDNKCYKGCKFRGLGFFGIEAV